jgi:hypothetical protein
MGKGERGRGGRGRRGGVEGTCPGVKKFLPFSFTRKPIPPYPFPLSPPQICAFFVKMERYGIVYKNFNGK